MDTFEGSPSDPLSLHKYIYAAANPVNRIDPSGHAAYFVERKLGISKGVEAWSAGYMHGYLMFTSSSDPGTGDPIETGQTVIDTFSWHPNVWDYDSSARPGVPGRVWENHPGDLHPGTMHRALLVTADPAQQAKLLNSINGWIKAAKPGYEFGEPQNDKTHYGNEVGEPHVEAPQFGVYYSLREQNCVWWATVMLLQGNVKVPSAVLSALASANHGEGAAPQVVFGQRSASDVRTLRGIPYGQFKMPAVLQLDLPSFGF